MVSTVVTAILVIIIMFGFSFFVFKNVIKRINDSAKRYFLEKLQEYNYLIDEKEEKLENLINQINSQERKIKNEQIEDDELGTIFTSEIEKRLEEMKKFKAKMKNKKTSEIIYDIPTPQYREESFFDTYKKLKKDFKVDNEKIIREFLEAHNDENDKENYQVLKEFRKQFTDKTIYECLTLRSEEQFMIVKEVIDEKVSDLIEFNKKFNNKNQFTVTKLIYELEEKIKEYNPNIYVYVGEEDLNYNQINERIRTRSYKNMSEGIIIYYKGKIYDYSI